MCGEPVRTVKKNGLTWISYEVQVRGQWVTKWKIKEYSDNTI